MKNHRRARRILLMRPIHFISSFFFDKNKACDCASMAEAEHFSSLRAAKIKIFPPPLLLYPFNFIKLHNKFLCKTPRIFVGNNNRRRRNRPAKETVIFYIYFVITQKICGFLYYLYTLLKKKS